MTDDIVTRLRNEICECGYAASFNELHKCLPCEAVDEIERWRTLADRMYAEIVKDYCWHCGAERTRNCYVSDLMDDYREACIKSGVRND